MSNTSSSDASTRDIIFSDRLIGPGEQLIFEGQFVAAIAFAIAGLALAALTVFGA
jgi:hypothetical protein